MFGVRDRSEEKQGEFWLERERLPKARMNAFYAKLEETLEGMGFAEGVRELCRPAYAEEAKGGRHGIDPVVYFKMLMVGFFEGLGSERGIAGRCSDSFGLRAFLQNTLRQVNSRERMRVARRIFRGCRWDRATERANGLLGRVPRVRWLRVDLNNTTTPEKWAG